MGVSINCILAYDTSPQELLKELDISIDESKAVGPFLPSSGETFISPWKENDVLVLERDEFICLPDKLTMLSKKHKLLICNVCEGATVSECSKWEHGELIWKLSFEPCMDEDGSYKLFSLNFDPPEIERLSTIAATEIKLCDMKEMQRNGPLSSNTYDTEVKLPDVDEMQVGFLTPIILFEEKTEFRYDDSTFHRYSPTFKHVLIPQ